MSHAMTNRLTAADRTYEVSLSDFEIVTPSFFLNTLHLPVIPDWIQIDRSFAGVLGGTCLLLMGSVFMIAASFEAPEPVQGPGAPKAAMVAPVALPAASAEVSNQAKPAKVRPPLAKRKPARKVAAKVPLRANFAKRPVKAPIAAKPAARPVKAHKRALGARGAR